MNKNYFILVFNIIILEFFTSFFNIEQNKLLDTKIFLLNSYF